MRLVVLCCSAFLGLAVTSCCRDEEGVTMSCSCTGVDSSGTRVPVSVPSGGCADTPPTSGEAPGTGAPSDLEITPIRIGGPRFRVVEIAADHVVLERLARRQIPE